MPPPGISPDGGRFMPVYMRHLLFVTGAGHRTGLAVSAVADYRFALLFLSDHTDDDRSYDCNQYGADYYGPYIV